MNNSTKTNCCPEFNPEPWNEKEIIWNDKLFLKDKVISFFHIPLNFGKVMIKNMEKIKKADAIDENTIVLSNEKSLWGSDIFISVKKNIGDAETIRISGKFLSKVYEGSYQNMGKWINDMKNYVLSKNKKIKNIYFYYTSCPKCSKIYGKNYVVILAEI
ncbi:hypothetical protein KA977_11465 [Candidatus Dependentiae bacterium]|nr:hypothetical protein [Candidatus Dependentiae bacterium]